MKFQYQNNLKTIAAYQLYFLSKISIIQTSLLYVPDAGYINSHCKDKYKLLRNLPF